ncbi:pyruvate kinase [Gemelliphila palaticanis]|uniref:Pyruvate kinase n=1 Tax=Gemelliphila palaticanis TaxID=81950 RepID=A0ABX2T1I3_9BACL|nr:pyruvate kinase [Gemella palaticanis]MBF0715135.1 pyruvate kinase [Gemella palaticanis]NYS47065.1 pyruvate kinase [Gemella palaticanis]
MKRKVKIIATLGTSTDDKIENIISSDLADAILIDNYFGSIEENSERIQNVKKYREQYKKNIAIVYDLDHIYAENKYKLIKIDFNNVDNAVKEEVDFIATPFINGVNEISTLKDYIYKRDNSIKLIVKIDSREAVENIDEILNYADSIMINRDELGMDYPLEDLPIVQKEVIKKSNYYGKEVILTTQMLQSMVYNPRPTRAEVSDVANATIDGVDAIMLIEETATGYYPEEALSTVNRIVQYIDKSYELENDIKNYKKEGMGVAHAMSMTTKYLIDKTNAKNIVTYTKTGNTAKFIAKYRPNSTILAVVPDNSTARKLALTWGVYTDIESKLLDMESMILNAPKLSKVNNLANKGDYVLITLGGDSKKGNYMPTDFITVREVE